MKIATVSEDATTLCMHFGRATKYVVFDVENGEIIDRTVLDKPSRHGRHHHHGPEGHDHHGHEHGHSHGHGHADHGAMLDPIRDCDAVIAGGMGRPMQQHLAAANLPVVMTRESDLETAVRAYLAGTLVHDASLLH